MSQHETQPFSDSFFSIVNKNLQIVTHVDKCAYLKSNIIFSSYQLKGTSIKKVV